MGVVKRGGQTLAPVERLTSRRVVYANEDEAIDTFSSASRFLVTNVVGVYLTWAEYAVPH